MLRKIVAVIILIPLALAIVMFAVSNRALVLIGFDPFGTQPPMSGYPLPLFLVLLIALIAGVILGGAATWSRQRKWRRRARRASAQLKEARAEAAVLRRRLEAGPDVPQAQTSIASIAYRHPTAA